MKELFRFMVRFFHGWRRKIGCVTLLMALASFSVWGLGHRFLMGYSIRGDHRVDSFGSSSNGLMWICFRFPEDSVMSPESVSAGWHFSSKPPTLLENIDTDWSWRCCGFYFATGIERTIRLPVTARIVPYWCIILPLSVVSAFLLIKQPRRSNQKKIPEPIQDEGA